MSGSLVGSILGQALGDALGFVVEAQPPGVARVYVNGWLRTGRAGEWAHPQFLFGQYSDDTQLARELLRSFRDAGGWEPAAFAYRLAGLFRDGRDVSAGWGTRSAALRLLGGVPWHESGAPAPYAGNGAAMRAGPLGLLLPDRDLMCRAASEQCRITHRDPRCAAGALGVARAVAIAADYGGSPGDFVADVADCSEMEDGSVAQAIRQLADWISLPPEAAARQVNRLSLEPESTGCWLGISSFVTVSLLWSLYAFLRSPDDYWETVCTAIAVGGDTDTMAAIAGAISGARLGPEGLPGPLVARVHDREEWGAEALSDLARACELFAV